MNAQNSAARKIIRKDAPEITSIERNPFAVIRAIAEHDFQLRHDSGCVVLQFVRWSPVVQ